MRKGCTGSSREVHAAKETATRPARRALERIPDPEPPLREPGQPRPRPAERLGAEQHLARHAQLVAQARLLVGPPCLVAVAAGVLPAERDARVEDPVGVEGDAAHEVAAQDEAVDRPDALRDDHLAHLERQAEAEEALLERARAEAHVASGLTREALLQEEGVDADDEVHAESGADVGAKA